MQTNILDLIKNFKITTKLTKLQKLKNQNGIKKKKIPIIRKTKKSF